MRVLVIIGKAKCQILFFLIVSILLSACQGSDYAYRTLSREDRGNNRYKGHYKVGSAYKIKNKIYTPREVTRYSKVGIASWYGFRDGCNGKKTANGDVYNKNLLTAAHRTLQLPSLVRVKNLENNRSIIVLVNDRGPYANDREIDLSERAATILGMKSKGTAKVKVQYLHAETNEFLKTLGLERKNGSVAKRRLENRKCSVNCHVKLVNLKYKHKMAYR
jgi:rare lipoprotein A